MNLKLKNELKAPGVGFEPTRPITATGSPGLPHTRLGDPGYHFPHIFIQ